MPEESSSREETQNANKRPQIGALRRRRWWETAAIAISLIAVLTGAYYGLYVTKRSDQLNDYYSRRLSVAAEVVQEAIGGLWLNVCNAKGLRDKLKLIPNLQVHPEDENGEDAEINSTQTALERTTKCNRPADLRTTANRIQGSTTLQFFNEHLWNRNLTYAQMDLATLLASDLPTAEFHTVLLTRKTGEVLVSAGSESLEVIQLPLQRLSQESTNKENPDDTRLASESLANYTAVSQITVAGQSYKAFSQPIRLPVDISWQALSENIEAETVFAEPESVWVIVSLQKIDSFRSGALAISATVLMVAFGLAILALFSLPYLKLRFLGRREALHAHDVLVLTTSLLVATTIATFSLLELYARSDLTDDLDRRLNYLAADVTSAFQDEIGGLDAQLRQLTQARTCDYEEIHSDILQEAFKLPPCSTSEEPEYLKWDSNPLLEMAYWIDADGMQTNKWTIKGNPTARINVGTREYYIKATDSRFLVDTQQGDQSDAVTDDGYFVESIRSRTTGDVHAVLSQRIKDGAPFDVSDIPRPVVAAALSPLLSVIDPVVPPGFEFAVIDADGLVMFHHDSARNLRENLFDELGNDFQVRAAVWSRAMKLVSSESLSRDDFVFSSFATASIDVSYHAKPYRLKLSRLDGTPWSLVVLYDVSAYGVARAEVLTIALALSLIYTISLLILYFCFHLGWVRRHSGTETLFHWLWPDTEKNGIYASTLALSAAVFFVWLFIMQLDSAAVAAVISGLLAAIVFGIIFGVFHHAAFRPNHGKSDSTHSGSNRSTTSSMVLAYEAIAHVLRRRLAESNNRGNAMSEYNLYISALVSVVVVIAVLPPIAFYRAANNEVMDLFVMGDQMQWADILHDRVLAKSSRYKKISLNGENEGRVQDAIYPDGGNLADAWDIHPAGWSINDNVQCDSESNNSSYNRPYPIVELVGSRLPGIVRESWDLRSLASDKNDRWSWSSQEIVFRGECYIADFSFGPQFSKLRNLELRSPTANLALPAFQSWEKWLISTAILVIFSVALWFITRSILRLVFLMELMKPRFLGVSNWCDLDDRKNVLVLRRKLQGEPPTGEDVVRIDAATLAENYEIRLPSGAKERGKTVTVIVDNFHLGLWDPKLAGRKQDLLERLLTLDCRIVVYSDINPVHYFTMVAGDYFRGATHVSPKLGRWAALLEEFARCRVVPDKEKDEADLRRKLQERYDKSLKVRNEKLVVGVDDQEFGHATPHDISLAIDHIAAECWPVDHLEEIALRLVEHPNLHEFADGRTARELIVNQVLDQAEAYYRVIWSISGKDERMVLYHLATHGFASWRGRELVRRLIHRGLVHLQPNPRIMNESFRRFVLGAELPEVLERWTAEEGASPWARLRTPMIVGVTGVFLFLFVTQPQLFSQSLAFTAAITAVVPTFIKLISLAADSRSSSGP